MSFIEMNPDTGRPVDETLPQDAAWRKAVQIWAEQYPLTTDSDLHQAAKYDSEHLRFVGQRLLAMGIDNDKVQAMASMTEDRMYKRLKKRFPNIS